jgi:phosphoglycerol transferase
VSHDAGRTVDRDIAHDSQPSTDRPASTGGRRVARTEPRLLRILGESLPFTAIAVLVAACIYRVWDQDWSVPFRGAGTDTTFIAGMVKPIQDHGWYLHNLNLNAPFGQQFYDYPSSGESLQLAILRFISLFTHGPYQTINVYYLLGFGALTMVTFAVVRTLRFGVLPSGGVALLYTFLQYHFAHMEQHLYRSTYLSAPLAALLLLWALSWRQSFLVDPDGPVWGWRELFGNLRRTRVASALVLCGVVATFETMTLAFFLTVLALVSVLAAARRRDWGHLGVFAVAVVTCALCFALAMAPTLRYWASNGTNTSTGSRVPTEQEAFGLQISQLLLPVPHHNVKALRGTQDKARGHSPITGEAGQELGFIGAAGFLVLLGWGLTHGIRGRDDRPLGDRGALLDHGALCTIVALPVATVSGFALLFSVAGFAQVRVWNRIVVLIAFFALLVVAMGFEWLLARWRTELPRLGAIGLVALITAAGIYDTSGVNWTIYGQPANIPELDAWVDATEHALPDQAMIFQFPVIQFPEFPAPGSTQHYDQLLPYLRSDGDLRWSAGGMRGRFNADWQLAVYRGGVTASLPGLAGLGFDAVSIDTHAYTPEGGTQIVAELNKALGPPMLRSTSGRWQLWDLRDYGKKAGLSPQQLHQAATALVGDLVDHIEPHD